MEKRKNIRSSNFELLRIIAMLMIVIYHIVCHCINVQLMNSTLFSYPTFYKNLLFLASIMPLGVVSNAIFILISGYFLINRSNIELDKTGKKLLIQLGFATIALLFSSFIVYKNNPGVFVNMLNIQSFNNMSWFVGYYFFIIVIAELFLNKYLAKLTKKNYCVFLIVIFAIIQLSWSRGLLDGIGGSLSLLLTGIFFYSIGGYIQKYNPLRNIRSYVFVFTIVASYILILLSYYNTTITKTELHLREQPGHTFVQTISSFDNSSIIIIFIALCMFELCRRIRIPNNKLINYIGSSTFMVYLIHDNEFFYSLWNRIDWIELLYNHPLRFVGELFKWSIATFVAGVIAYIVFNFICKLCVRLKWLVIKSPKDEK